MSNLSPDVAQALAAQGAVSPEMAQQLGPVLVDQGVPVVPTVPDVVSQAMPPLTDPSLAQAPLADPVPVIPEGVLPNPPVPFGPNDQIAPDYTAVKTSVPNMPQVPPNAQSPAADAVQAEPQVADYEQQAQAADSVAEQIVAKNVAKQAQAHAVKVVAADKEQEDAEKVKLEDRIKQIDAQPQVRGLAQIFSSGSTGEKIGAALALLAGGVAQGILGLKENPAMTTINSLVEQQAQRNKLNQEEKESLRKQIYDNVLLKLRKKELSSEDALRKSQIQENIAQVEHLRGQAAQKQAELAAAHAVSAVLNGNGNSVPAATPEIAARNKQVEDVLSYLDAKDPKRAETLRERQVITPDGRMEFAKVDKQRVAEFEKTIRQPNESATALLKQIREFSKTASSLSLGDRAKMQTDLVMAAGKLRIPITGPGAMTEDEFKRLIDTLGNPTKVFSIQSIENMKLDSVINNLEQDTRAGAAQIGVRWPQGRDEQIIQKLMERGYDRAQAVQAVHNKKQ